MAGTFQLPVVLFVATPAAPAVVNVGTPGVAARSYEVVGTDSAGKKTAASPAGSTSTGNAAPNGTNFDRLSWSAIPGAVSYDVYRVAGGATQGKIGSTTDNQFDDTGLVGDASTAPAVNATGVGEQVPVGEFKDFTFQVDGTFVADLVIEARIEGAVGWVPSVTQSAPGFLFGSGTPQAVDWVRVRMISYTSGAPAVYARGNGRV